MRRSIPSSHRMEPGAPALEAVVAAEELDVQRDRPGRAADREVAGDGVVVAARGRDRGRDECDLGVRLGSEEVGGTEVAVALLVAGGDARCLDGDRDRRVGRGDGVDVSGALELVEVATDLRHHRVTGGEADARVARVQRVVAGDVLDGDRGGLGDGLALGAVEQAHDEILR